MYRVRSGQSRLFGDGPVIKSWGKEKGGGGRGALGRVKEECVESLQSHFILTMSHWSRHKRPGFKSPGGYLCENGILLLASRYIGDPDVIDHCGLV